MIDFAALFERSPSAYAVYDRELRFVGMNEAYLRLTGKRREELIGRNPFEAFPAGDGIEAASVRTIRAAFERVLARSAPEVILPLVYPVATSQDAEPSMRYWSATLAPLLDEQGEVRHILQHTIDVSPLGASAPTCGEQRSQGVFLHTRARDVRHEDHQLARELAVLRCLFDQAPGLLCVMRGPSHVVETANAAWLDFIGNRTALGLPIAEVTSEAEQQGYFEILDRVFRTGESFVGRGMRLWIRTRPGGPLEERFVDFVYQPIFGADGAVWGIFAQGSDTTERFIAARELERYRNHLEQLVEARTRELQESEKKRAEAQKALFHAQKMEAIGNLTGGIAHDFNNLLQVVAGSLELLRHERSGSERALRWISTADRAVERGASLSSQLLAFARRQPVKPVVLDVRRQLAEIEQLLRQAVGEGVTCAFDLLGEPANTLADPSQLENVFLNLAINARDAMEGHGTLRIRARNVVVEGRCGELAPGPWIRIDVEDTGCGMPPEVVERAVDPFFTTKAEGRGTGLGLSMVYGAVKQAGGHLEIHSEVGTGTEMRIFLPQVQAEVAPAEAPPGAAVDGDERIIVAEDDEDLRRTVAELLQRLAYEVFEAADGAQVLELLAAGPPVDLLFSDVVMPGPICGHELVRRARAIQPGLRVLFTSGYAEDTIQHEGRIDPGIDLIAKPYRLDQLAGRIRAALAVVAPQPAARAPPPTG